MATRFDSSFFIGNRQRLREACPDIDLFIVTANGLLQRNGDATYPFRQDSNFWYLTGIGEPDIVLVIDRTQEYLIVPAREAVRIAFDGAIDETGLAKISGIQAVFDGDEGWLQLARELKRVRRIGILEPMAAYDERHGFYANPARERLLKKLMSIKPGLETQDLRPILARQRMIKQAVELRAIQQAVDITAGAFKTVRDNLAVYKSEAEIEADITAHFRKNGAHHAYTPIVAAGKNACILHYTANTGKLAKNSSVLIDAGAEVNMYTADITRTLFRRPTKRQQRIARAVLDAHAFALSLLKPGLLLRQYEHQIEQYVGEKLRELGLMKEKEVTRKAVRAYYPHAASHFLGLDAHDAGDYSMPLAPGMVLTVEPGIYVPEERFGIRIEDDVVVEKNGVRVLSGLLPKDPT